MGGLAQAGAVSAALLDSASVSTIVPIPSGTETFSYPVLESPVLSGSPSELHPVGAGKAVDGVDILNLQVGFNQFAGPVDIYFGLYSPEISDTVFLLSKDKTLQPLSAGLVPWKENYTASISESLFGDISISGLPSATYYLYVLVTPAGTFNTYYFWTSSFRIGSYDSPNGGREFVCFTVNGCDVTMNNFEFFPDTKWATITISDLCSNSTNTEVSITSYLCQSCSGGPYPWNTLTIDHIVSSNNQVVSFTANINGSGLLTWTYPVNACN